MLAALLDFVQAPRDIGRIAPIAQISETRRLLLLDGGIDAQRLVRIFVVADERVDADNLALPGVDLARYPVGRAFDLCFLEALLDRGHRAAEFGDPVQQLSGPRLDVIGHRLDRVRARERVDGGGQVGLVRQHLLGTHRERRRLLRGQRDRLVIRIGVQ